MANSKTTTKTTKPMVQMTEKPKGVYADAQAELKRLGQDDAAGRKVDKALEEARGKDTLRLHVALHAIDLADERAHERQETLVRLNERNHHNATTTLASGFQSVNRQVDATTKNLLSASSKNTDAILASVEEAKMAILDDAAEAYNETIDLAESNHTAVVDLVNKSTAQVVRDVQASREDLLNGQAVLGEAVTASRQAAQNAFDALNKSVQTVYDSLAKSQESDGQAIMNLLREQHEAQITLVQTIYNDLDTKMKHFREEMSNDIEKLATTVGNQSASVRGDMSVVLSLLSDVRKDQIGRPERR